jgi:hypothetical protein
MKTTLSVLSILSLSIALSLTALSCSMSPMASNGGNTSETTNGVVMSGIILQPDGTPAPNALIKIRASGFLPDTASIHLGKSSMIMYSSVNLLTDLNGVFNAESLDTGKSYDVEAQLGVYSAMFECQIPSVTDTVHVAPQTLRASGSITGAIAFSGVAPCRVYIRVYGIENGIILDPPATHFTISGLAPGSYCIKVYPSVASYDDEDRCGITILPDSTQDAGTFIIKLDN